MKKNALLIFVKKPVLGRVKTRLAREIGDEKALHLYKELLRHTQKLALAVDADRYLFWDEALKDEDDWPDNNFQKREQRGDDLGAKMQNSFVEVLRNGYRRAVIIGTDCPSLDKSHIEEAFHRLDHYDVVIGPAADGGYYLLGLKTVIPDLFHNKSWSTENVLQETKATCEKLGVSYSLLDTLVDIDNKDDLLRQSSFWQQLAR